MIVANKKQEKEEEAMRSIRRARTELMSSHPFWGDLAFGMPIKIDSTLVPPTAATDGEGLYYHPDFVKTLTKDELVFVTGHEVLHAALLHVTRRGDRNPMKWNIACDIVVNHLLAQNCVGKMPKDLIFDPSLYAQGEGLVSRIYDLLPNKPENYPKQAMDDFKQGEGASKATPQELANKWRGKLARAQEVAKQAGKMPSNLDIFVDQIVSETVAWEEEIFNEITSNKGDDRTYAKRNRRTASLDVLLPGKYGEKMGDLVFAIDCSGSTSNEMVARCANEIERAMRVLRPEKTHVIYWDTSVKKVEVYEPDDELNVRAYGRGGTSVGCVFDYIEENNIDPQHCIIATDLAFGGDFGSSEPDYPVIWCIMESKRTGAPFGKEIHTD
jgi:predicted metal-dependent peptidase